MTHKSEKCIVGSVGLDAASPVFLQAGPGIKILQMLIIKIIKGLVALCHSFCIYYFYFIQYIHSYIHHSTFIHKHSLRPISMSSQQPAQWAEPPWGAEPRFELGPALQQASALPSKPRCTLNNKIMNLF
jgi:hypothetical protein